MMYLHLGQDVMVVEASVVGIFDTDNTTQSAATRTFLSRAEKAGRLVTVFEDIPKSFVICEERGLTKVYLTQISAATLLRRAESKRTDFDLQARSGSGETGG
jgi:extracellular matrix regulatory protein B